jgi:hypothetical protein
MDGFTEVTLDGCCSEGGGAAGLVRAGHYVVGVDTDASCRDGYLRSGAHEFICADILDVLQDVSFLSRFTFASLHPPCQGYSGMSNCRPGLAGEYARLIKPIQPLADELGIPFVIENVEGARSALRDPVTVCMWMFGRPGYRHRLLEAGGGLVLHPPPWVSRTMPPPWTDEVPSWAWNPPAGYDRVGIVRRRPDCGWPHPVPVAKAGHWTPGKFVSAAGHERKEPVFSLMEIGWMSTRDRVKEAIPPYLGYWTARQLACWRQLGEAAA